jgi:electron-transferring-flavoprotein dehydrogenase
VLEKAREAGQHCLSGALLDPRSMKELLPGFRRRSPARRRGSQGRRLLPYAQGSLQASDHASAAAGSRQLCHFDQPLCEVAGGKVEEAGITIFTGFAGSELLFDGNRVAGVRTDDKGVDKQNQQKSNFEPGYDVKAKVVVLAEGRADR